MNIKILSDSTCDLPKEILDKYDISLFPLTVIKDSVNYLDNVTITPADIFAHVAAGGDLWSVVYEAADWATQNFLRHKVFTILGI